MAQCNLNRTETAHGHADDGAIFTICGDWEPGLCVSKKIFDNVVLIPIRGTFYRVYIIRIIAFRHDENKISFDKATEIRVVGPVAKIASAAMQQKHNRQLPMRCDHRRKHYAICHLTAKGCAAEHYVAQDDIGIEERMIGSLGRRIGAGREKN